MALLFEQEEEGTDDRPEHPFWSRRRQLCCKPLQSGQDIFHLGLRTPWACTEYRNLSTRKSPKYERITKSPTPGWGLKIRTKLGQKYENCPVMTFLYFFVSLCVFFLFSYFWSPHLGGCFWYDICFFFVRFWAWVFFCALCQACWIANTGALSAFLSAHPFLNSGSKKGGFSRIQCHPQEGNAWSRTCAQECMRHWEHYSQARRRSLQPPPLLLVPDAHLVLGLLHPPLQVPENLQTTKLPSPDPARKKEGNYPKFTKIGVVFGIFSVIFPLLGRGKGFLYFSAIWEDFRLEVFWTL